MHVFIVMFCNILLASGFKCKHNSSNKDETLYTVATFRRKACSDTGNMKDATTK